MTSIKLVDLNNQHARMRNELDTAVKAVMDSGLFINGPQVKGFEEDLSQYLGGHEVVGCANGTDALQLALMTLNLPEDSEVIVPDFTFVSTAEVVKQLGFKPVLVDVNPDTFLIDPEAARQAVTPHTRAIMPVHLFGQCAPMEAILSLAEAHNLYVVEDVAQALGASCYCRGSWQKAGTMGTLGTTSFFPVKNLGCMGDGGALFTADPALAYQARVLRQHGMSAQYHYHHVGLNSRLDTMQAAILQVKLPYLDQFNRERQAVAAAYDEALSDLQGIQVPKRTAFSEHVFQQYTLRVPNQQRDHLKAFLDDHGIPSKVFYPTGLHEHEVYQDGKSAYDNLSASLKVRQEVLSLPMHTEISYQDINYITQKIREWAGQLEPAE
jgi:dTDP-4-amino-4,6-dideoxygalactose transaminase